MVRPGECRCKAPRRRPVLLRARPPARRGAEPPTKSSTHTHFAPWLAFHALRLAVASPPLTPGSALSRRTERLVCQGARVPNQAGTQQRLERCAKAASGDALGWRQRPAIPDAARPVRAVLTHEGPIHKLADRPLP